MNFLEKKINDVCYFVTLKRIEEWTITGIQSEKANLYITVKKKGDYERKLKCNINDTSSKEDASYSDRVFYADLNEAKEVLYKLRNNEIDRLFNDMLRSIDTYQRMSKCLRVYTDVNYTDEEWDQIYTGKKE